ncbi:MAG: NF038122 family metalloprotease, partial [Blastocatellia bacterium]
MKNHIRYAGSGIKLTLLLTALGCLFAGGLASVIFQPTTAAQDASARLNPKPYASLQVIESFGEQTVCRDATEEEARAIEWRDPEQRLLAINHEESATLSPAQSQDGLKIILRGTQQLEQNPAAKAAFIRAAQRWEALIQSPITMVIDVDYGPTWFGVSYPDQAMLGATYVQRVGADNMYAELRSSLIIHASSAQEAALYNSLPQSQLPTDIGEATHVSGPVAVMRALGMLDPVADPDGELARLGPPPAIGFNSAKSFDFDPSDGIEPGKWDFDAYATHEIGHALGFASNVGMKEASPSFSVSATPWDLFRFRPGVTSSVFSTAERILSSGGEQVFFSGEQELALSTGRPDTSSGDGKQGSHWKDDALTGRYVGIMDPTLPAGKRQEITENDLKALDLMGYRLKSNTNPNPTPNQQTVELKLDDGSLDSGYLSDGLMIVNRLTPPSYPATLQKLRFIFAMYRTQPDPTGKPVTLVIFTDPSGAGQPPAGAEITRINTTVPGANSRQFLEVTVPNGPTINSGDFYVGFRAPSPHQGVGFALDK